MEKNDLVGDALKIMPPEYVPLLYKENYFGMTHRDLPENVWKYTGRKRITCGPCFRCGFTVKSFMVSSLGTSGAGFTPWQCR